MVLELHESKSVCQVESCFFGKLASVWREAGGRERYGRRDLYDGRKRERNSKR